MSKIIELLGDMAKEHQMGALQRPRILETKRLVSAKSRLWIDNLSCICELIEN